MFCEVRKEYRDPQVIKNEFSYGKTPVSDLLQEHSGHVMIETVSRLAGRCAACGPPAAVAGYGMEHFLTKNKVG